jgi:hypothetical protein
MMRMQANSHCSHSFIVGDKALPLLVHAKNKQARRKQGIKENTIS